MTVRVDVEPALLQWAVDRAGWDAETAERRAPKLGAWMTGDVQPTLKQLESFAQATHAPFGLLFLSEPPVENIPIPDMRTIGNARLRRPSADLLDTIYLCQSRQDWYHDWAQEIGLDEVAFVGSATTQTAPHLVAAQIRDVLHFDLQERSAFASWEEALRRLIDRIESIGVLVMVSGIVGSNSHRKLAPEEFRGFALADPYAPLIFINGADTKAAQIFTLIHELAHLSLGSSALSDAAMTATSGPEEELWCNQVAADVLVPLTALRADYRGTVAEGELERLARQYRVSTLVVLRRIHDAGFLTRDVYWKHFTEERARVIKLLAGRRSNEGDGNYYYTQPLRLSRRFAQAVLNSTLEGSTTYRDAYKLLGTKKQSTFENLADELGVA